MNFFQRGVEFDLYAHNHWFKGLEIYRITIDNMGRVGYQNRFRSVRSMISLQNTKNHSLKRSCDFLF